VGGGNARAAAAYSDLNVPIRYRWDRFGLDLDRYRLERDGEAVPLEPKAFNLLALMVQRPEHVFTKQEIFNAVWPDTAVSDHALTRVIAQIRRAIGDEAREARFLETVPTRGYRWIHPVEPVQDDRSEPATLSSPPVPAIGAPAAIRRPPAAHLITVAAVAVLAAAGAWAWTSSRTPAQSADRESSAAVGGSVEHGVRWPVQLTTNAGLDLHPAVSPHGDAVAFVSDRNGTFEIYIRALDGSASETPLTSDGAQNVQPAWSPDGKFLAYHSRREGGIWIIAARGGTARQIVAEGSSPAWSPDGAHIAYQSDEHADVAPAGFGAQAGSTIMLVAAAGGAPRKLTHPGHPEGGHASPAWSHDGRYLSFTVFEGGRQNGLWLLDRQTRKTTPLHHGGPLYESAFSLDDRTIYAAGGEAFIVGLPFDRTTGTLRGPAETIPIPGVPGVRDLSISRDGSTLTFAGLGLNSQIWSQRVAADGTGVGQPAALTKDTSRRNSTPVVSPDGTHVAYTSSRRGQDPNVWVMRTDGTDAQQLTPDATSDYWPDWSPDSRRVVFLSRRNGHESLWSVDVTTRMEERLFDIPQDSQAGQVLTGRLAELRFSPSITRLALSMFVPPTGRRALFISAFEPFAPRALSDGSMSLGYPAWSPDERSIAVEIKDGSSTHAGIVDVRTGAERRLTSERGQTWVRSWSPDGRKIAAAVLREGVWSLRWIDVDTGREGIITPPDNPRFYYRYPDWSRRGGLVIFERAEMVGNIWQLAIR
jgi:Tol biopolymer transport system component/DNA-binding winged helix-turn-helix (wHTH) protein